MIDRPHSHSGDQHAANGAVPSPPFHPNSDRRGECHEALVARSGLARGTRGSLRNASRWERLINSLAVEPELQTHTRFHYAVWQQAGEQVRAGDLARARSVTISAGSRPCLALSRSSRSRPWPCPPMSSGSRVPSTSRATLASCRALTNPATVIATGTSPGVVRTISGRCSARPLITLGARRIRCIHRVPGAATRLRSSQWRRPSLGGFA